MTRTSQPASTRCPCGAAAVLDFRIADRHHATYCQECCDFLCRAFLFHGAVLAEPIEPAAEPDIVGLRIHQA
jgi:hypothetical protein